MALCSGQQICRASDTHVLIGQTLGVQQRQVEEMPLYRREGKVGALGQTFTAEADREFVEIVGPRRTAECVPREIDPTGR